MKAMKPEDVRTGQAEHHLLDVREGAQHIPPGELGDRLGELPAERRIVAVCRSGIRSAAAARGLTQLGFDALNLDGGVTAWSRAGLPLVDKSGRAGRVI